jgi:hypothetical protein
MTDTNKRLLISRVAAIRIDVHPAGKNLNNTSCALHTWFAYGPEPYVSHDSHRTTFHQSPRSRKKPIHPEEVLTTKDRLTRSSFWVALFFLPCDSPRVGERSFGPVVTQLLQLTGPINISMRLVRSVLARGANPSVLNLHRRGLQP